jgi:hypothetical protein
VDTPGEGECAPVPTDYQGVAYRLAWSPDSQQIAFSEDPAAQGLESDLWLADAATGRIANLTDDGVTGPYAEAASGRYTLDYLPMWDPATGLLYFWRSAPATRPAYSLALMQIDPAGGEPAPVADVSETLGGNLIRFGVQRFYLSGPSVLSPDGSQVAVLVTSAQAMAQGEADGLWLLDLTGDGEPVRVATAADFQAGLPAWQDQPAVPRGLQWTADGAGLVVVALSDDLRLPLTLVYYVDVAARTLATVAGFEDVGSRADFFTLPGEGQHPLRYSIPWTAAVAPTASAVLLVNDLGGVVTIASVPLPPDGVAPQLVLQVESPGYDVWTRASHALDGKILVDGLLLETTAGEAP